MENLSFSIDRSKHIPAYYQIEEFIQERIEHSDWPPDTQIPTEKEICELFDVSRSVVRQAIGDLVSQGLLHRTPGKGTFVAKPKIAEGLIQSLTGFYEDMTGRGMTPHTEVLEQEVIPAPGKIARLLQIKNGQDVHRIVRLRGVAGEEKLSLSTTFIPYELAPDLIHEDLTQKSLYELLTSYGLKIQYADRIIEAGKASREDASLLGVEVNSPLLVMTNISFLENGVPVEYYIAKHSGDRSKLKIRLVRETK